jgi:hypothetical protein
MAYGRGHTRGGRHYSSQAILQDAARQVHAAEKESRDASAEDAYDIRYAKILQQIGDLQTALAFHSERQYDAPENWGYAGDLTVVAEMLANAIRIVQQNEER